MVLRKTYRIPLYEPEAVCYHQNYIYVGTSRDVFKISTKHEEVPQPYIRFTQEQKSGVTSVATSGNQLYILVGITNSNFKVQVHQIATKGSRGAGDESMIRQWQTDVPYVQFNKLRVMNDEVIVPDPVNKRFKIYKISGDSKKQFPCDLLAPGCVSMDVSGNDCVVATVKSTGTVFRFNMKTGNVMWKTALKEPEGVACYKDSYVLVTNKNVDNRISILDMYTGKYHVQYL